MKKKMWKAAALSGRLRWNFMNFVWILRIIVRENNLHTSLFTPIVSSVGKKHFLKLLWLANFQIRKEIPLLKASLTVSTEAGLGRDKTHFKCWIPVGLSTAATGFATVLMQPFMLAIHPAMSIKGVDMCRTNADLWENIVTQLIPLNIL